MFWASLMTCCRVMMFPVWMLSIATWSKLMQTFLGLLYQGGDDRLFVMLFPRNLKQLTITESVLARRPLSIEHNHSTLILHAQHTHTHNTAIFAHTAYTKSYYRSYFLMLDCRLINSQVQTSVHLLTSVLETA